MHPTKPLWGPRVGDEEDRERRGKRQNGVRGQGQFFGAEPMRKLQPPATKMSRSQTSTGSRLRHAATVYP